LATSLFLTLPGQGQQYGRGDQRGGHVRGLHHCHPKRQHAEGDHAFREDDNRRHDHGTGPMELRCGVQRRKEQEHLRRQRGIGTEQVQRHDEGSGQKRTQRPDDGVSRSQPPRRPSGPNDGCHGSRGDGQVDGLVPRLRQLDDGEHQRDAGSDKTERGNRAAAGGTVARLHRPNERHLQPPALVPSDDHHQCCNPT
jgi:hypothetical protein